MRSVPARWIACLLATLSFHNATGAPLPSGEGDAAYEDRLIPADGLWADPEAGDVSYDESGPVRGARIELFKTILKRNGESIQENGVLFGLKRETENYGVFSLEGSLRDGGNDVITAWQRNLAFEGGWRANNGLGMINTPSIDLTRRQYRFFIPTMTMVGGSTEFINGPGTQFSAGIGQPGIYTGIRVPAFLRLPGSVFSAGGQFAPSENWEAGIQVVGATDVFLNPNPHTNFKGPALSTTGMLASAAWKGTGALTCS